MRDDSQAVALFVWRVFRVRNPRMLRFVVRNIVLFVQCRMDHGLTLMAAAQRSRRGGTGGPGGLSLGLASTEGLGFTSLRLVD